MRSINWILSDIFHYLITASSPWQEGERNTADQSRETTTISPTILKNTGKRRLTISKTKVPIICGPGPGSPSHNFFDERKTESEGSTASHQSGGEWWLRRRKTSKIKQPTQPEDLWELDQLQVFGYQQSLEWQPVFVLKTDFPLFSRK